MKKYEDNDINLFNIKNDNKLLKEKLLNINNLNFNEIAEKLINDPGDNIQQQALIMVGIARIMIYLDRVI